ncbi:MAG: hypothetical protein ACREC1_01365 [Methylovirgula sp.]
MAPNWAEVVQAMAAIATIPVALGGTFFVWRQIKHIERTIHSTTHERLTAESFELLKFLASVPDTYAYFYEGQPLGPEDAHREFILYATEAIVNYMEHIVAQKPNMNAEDWDVWKRFIEDAFKRAPVVRAHLERHASGMLPNSLQSRRPRECRRSCEAVSAVSLIASAA